MITRAFWCWAVAALLTMVYCTVAACAVTYGFYLPSVVGVVAVVVLLVLARRV